VDSGATAHMCKNQELFTEINNSETKYVQVANKQRIKVEGSGKIRMEVRDWKNNKVQIQLENVLYVPELAKNLLSTQALSDRGHSILIKKGESYIQLERSAKIPIKRIGKLLELKCKPVKEESLHITTKDDTLELWH
jgi:N-acetyl-beta-hexosaminidase